MDARTPPQHLISLQDGSIGNRMGSLGLKIKVEFGVHSSNQDWQQHNSMSRHLVRTKQMSDIWKIRLSSQRP